MFDQPVLIGIDHTGRSDHARDRLGLDVAALHRDDDRDPTLVAVQIWTWIHGIVDLCTADPDSPFPPPEALIDDLTRCLGLVPTG